MTDPWGRPRQKTVDAADVKPDADGIKDGREVARSLIRQALSVLAPYADGCPACTYGLLSGIGWEVMKENPGQGRIDAAVLEDRTSIDLEVMAAHVARARPSTVAMLERFGQTHHREHLGEGVRLTEDDAETVRRLAELTGRTAAEIIERVNRSPDDRQRFRVTVSLASETWDYLDGTTGQWSERPDKQDRQLASYAAALFGNA